MDSTMTTEIDLKTYLIVHAPPIPCWFKEKFMDLPENDVYFMWPPYYARVMLEFIKKDTNETL
jgi:hypothetical protein